MFTSQLCGRHIGNAALIWFCPNREAAKCRCQTQPHQARECEHGSLQPRYVLYERGFRSREPRYVLYVFASLPKFGDFLVWAFLSCFEVFIINLIGYILAHRCAPHCVCPGKLCKQLGGAVFSPCSSASLIPYPVTSTNQSFEKLSGCSCHAVRPAFGWALSLILFIGTLGFCHILVKINQVLFLAPLYQFPPIRPWGSHILQGIHFLKFR